MPYTQLSTIIIIAVVIAIVLVAGQFLISLLGIAIPLIVGGIVLMLVADKVMGGTALNQIADKITAWLKGLGA